MASNQNNNSSEETQINVNSTTTNPSAETSPNTSKKSVKSVWSKTENTNTEAKTEGSPKQNQTAPEQNTSSSSIGDENQISKESTREVKGAINNISRGGAQPWKTRKPSTDEGKESEPLADATAWPTLDQAKVDVSPTLPTKEKKSPREVESSAESADADSANKKKSINWVPMQVEIQSGRPANGAPRRGRGGMRNGNYHGHHNNYQQQPQQNGQAPQQSQPNGTAPMTRGSWRKPGQRGGMTRGRGGRGGYMAPVMYYTVPVEGEALKNALQFQIEYYFSVENLCKDLYLRSQMDAEGWIPLSIISAFNRVKALTQDPKLILDVLQNSTLVECNQDKIRRKDDWKTWLMQPAPTTQPTTVN